MRTTCSLCKFEAECTEDNGTYLCISCKILKDMKLHEDVENPGPIVEPRAPERAKPSNTQRNTPYIRFFCRSCQTELCFPYSSDWQFQIIGLVQARHKCGTLFNIVVFPGMTPR